MEKKNGNVFFRITFSVFLIFCIVSVVTVQIQVNTLKAEKEGIAQEISVAKEKLEELDYEYSLDEDAYLERVQRKNGYHGSGEIVFREEN